MSRMKKSWNSKSLWLCILLLLWLPWSAEPCENVRHCDTEKSDNWIMTRSSNRPICGSQEHNQTRSIEILLQHWDIAISARISTMVTHRSDGSLLKVLQPFIHGYQLAKNYYCANFDCFPGVILFQLDKLLARYSLQKQYGSQQYQRWGVRRNFYFYTEIMTVKTIHSSFGNYEEVKYFRSMD